MLIHKPHLSLYRLKFTFSLSCNFSAAKITSDEVREAVLEFVAEHCCYGKGAAEKMIFNQILPSNALHVSIVSNNPLVLNFDKLSPGHNRSVRTGVKIKLFQGSSRPCHK